jgi:acetylornithine deacetylase/succinyl-diaminopimelate desuccinylase-like protein
VNLKFLLEGEEEIGSPNLQAFIAGHRELLAADFALNPDTGMLAPDLPTITYALRGLAYFEIRLTGPDHDLHSGVFGGAVHNPAQVLCELIAGMHDSQGRITLPGFYEKVLPLSPEERQELSRLPMDEQFYLQASGAPALYGEEGFSPEEQVSARPTLEVNGLSSGYTGPGGKTVLPSKAIAKISMRLVPGQDPNDIGPQLVQYLKEHAPNTVRWEVSELQGNPAAISDRNSAPIHALSQAMETVWGKRPVFRREGGSVPVVTHFQQYLQIESLNTGFGLPTDNMHSPNEKLHLPTVYKGMDTLIHFFYNVASNSL